MDSLRKKLQICYCDDINLEDTVNLKNAAGIAKDSLLFISSMLFDEYGRKAVIIVDEYDVPLQKAKVNGYYDEMLDVVDDMLGNALKTNNSMEKGFVTGCLRIAFQSIFTDFNNFVTCGLMMLRIPNLSV